MLYKIIFKNFKSNLKSYILFFISNIIAVAELFAFWGMNSIIKNVVSDEVTAEALRYDFWIAAGLVTFITVFLMVFAMRNYIKLRIKDYSTFILLGMKKRMSYMLVLICVWMSGFSYSRTCSREWSALWCAKSIL